MEAFINEYNVRQVYDLIRRYGGAKEMSFDDFVIIALINSANEL